MKQAMSKSALQHSLHGQMSRRVREGLLIIFSSVALYLLVALVTHHTDDPGWSQTGNSNSDSIMNLAGKTGAWFSDILFFLFGYVAYCVPLAVLLIAVFIYKPMMAEAHRIKSSMWFIRSTGLLLALITSCGLASMHYPYSTAALPMTAGGLLGVTFKTALVMELSHVGATIILLAFFLASITLLTGLSWLRLTDLLGRYSLLVMNRIHQEGPGVLSSLLEGLHALKESDRFNQVKDKITQFFQGIHEKAMYLKSTMLATKGADTQVNNRPATDDFEDGHLFKSVMSRQVVLEESEEEAPDTTQKSKQNRAIRPIRQIGQASQLKRVTEKPARPTKSVSTAIPMAALCTPSLSLLDTAKAKSTPGFNKKELDDLSQLVERRLTEFGVEARVVAVHPGPVVTRFELDLAAGIKVSKISGLAKDLARSLSVISVRVVEVIPGKSYIGIEIPNQQREIVQLKDILASVDYQGAQSPLTLGLGKDISGKPISVDLAKMPHLLVAGTTGSGKSVGLNAMLLSILYKATPEEVRMILIDPKMLELSVYDNIPHLLTPVVTDMKEAASALRWCVGEMESRYQLMAALGVRNLASYNQKVDQAQQAEEPLFDPLWEPHFGMEPEVLTKKPYIVVVVDEFADMIMVVGKQVEELIARIAQKARAAGIHLILATQRPSVDVITGLIKANIPTRIAFQVSCRIDSRTILDQPGAEQLLGHGDMLYLAPGAGIPQRIHGAFVSDDEVHKVANQWRRQGKPDYIDNILKSANPIPGIDSPRAGDEYDELYDEAVKIVTETRRPSISHVQRRLRIGYNRAACLIEQMEREGVLSPIQANGTREVLAPPPVER